MHHLSPLPRREGISLYLSEKSSPGKVLRVARIKPTPLLVRPVTFEFQPCGRTPGILIVLTPAQKVDTYTSIHRLQRGLPGYLILFALRFRASASVIVRKPPSPLVFLPISMHFPHTGNHFLSDTQEEQFQCTPQLPRYFTSDLSRLHALAQ